MMGPVSATTIGLVLSMQSPVDIFPDKALAHLLKMGLQIAADGFGNQLIHVGDPAALHHGLRLLPKLIWDFGFYGCGHDGYAFGKLEL